MREQMVIQVIRLPRVLLATFVGLGLGMAGTALQGIMRNPLVGPDLVGVSSGAAAGGALAIMLDWPGGGMVFLAFIGGMVAMGCTFGLAGLGRGGADGMALIMAGIFIGAFFLACVGLGQFLANDGQLLRLQSWLLGTFNGANPGRVWLVGAPTLAGGAVLMLTRWRLNLLSLGALDVVSLGVNARRLRVLVIVLVSLIIAAQVAVSGIIGWIGLVIPHCARMLVGPDHRRLLPAAALLGAMFTLGIDDFTRVVLRRDVPAGVMTTLLGTPFICFLFWKKQSKGWSDD
jgi:iron complex transport system permease protein